MMTTRETQMKIYTTSILNVDGRSYDPDRIECKSFETLDSAIEYLIDTLYDEGIIRDDEVPVVEKSLREDGVWCANANGLEIHVSTSELCDW
jgi:hypothetical protein